MCFEIIAYNIWYYFPPHQLGKWSSHYITNAVFSSLYTYMRNLHLWHIKTENSYRIKK